MSTRSKLVGLGVSVLGTLALAASPASAAGGPETTVRGFSEDRTTFGSLTACQNIFDGRVTSDDGAGRINAAIDAVTFNFCDAGTRVTTNSLPWKLDLQRDVSYTITGVDVSITTSNGTCHYTGSINGVQSFPDSYDVRGTLTRRTAGCDGPDRINISNLIEVISVR